MHRVRWVYPVVVVVLVLAYYLVPGTHVAAVGAVGSATAVCILVASVAYRPLRRRAWLSVAVGVAIVAAGDVSYNLLATGSQADSFPSWPDVLYLAAYLPLAVGLLGLGLARIPSRDVTGWIETAALTLAGTLLIWITLVTPTVTSLHLTGVGKAVMVAGWIGDVAIMATAVRVLVEWPRNLAAVLLFGAIVALLVGDVLYGMDLISGRWHSGGPHDLGLLAFFALAGTAACRPSMARIGSPSDRRRRVGSTGLFILAVALLIAPSALVAEATSGPVRTPYAVAVVSAAVGGLVWWRMYLAIRHQRRAAVLDAEVRHASRQLSLAIDIDTVAGILAAALEVLADGSPTAVRLAAGPDPAPPTRPDTEELPVPVDDGQVIFTAPAADIIELEDTLTGLANQAGIALQRIDLTAQIQQNLQEQAILAYRAAHDPLTGLANADTFRDQLRAARHRATNGLTAVLFIDLDDFKAINDTLGHDAGDTVLVVTARRINSCLRRHDLGARLGGDEFAVLLRDLDTAAAADGIAQRISDTLAAPTTVGGLPVECAASIGVATATRPDEYDALLRHADTALYAAKNAGKGHWRRYQPTMTNPPQHPAALHTDLQRLARTTTIDTAIPGASLALHYQPIVELSTSTVHGYEALIRWQQPHGATITAQELINTAERAGLMPLVGDWVLRQAFTDLPHLPPGEHDPCYLAINVSATQLRRGAFLDHIRDQLTTTGIPGSRLVIEITENQPLTDDDHIWHDLDRIRQTGVRIAIDDYGTGYASLAYLRHPAIDIVKLDRSFLSHDPVGRNPALLHAVVDLTRNLGIHLIAEGVEDDTTRTRLIELGCRYGQGHLFAAAQPLADIITASQPPR